MTTQTTHDSNAPAFHAEAPVVLDVATQDAVELCKKRREAIADAIASVHRRNRIAAYALILSAAVAILGVAALWVLKTRESSDPVALRFKSPVKFELQNPLEFVPVRPGADGAGGSVAK